MNKQITLAHIIIIVAIIFLGLIYGFTFLIHEDHKLATQPDDVAYIPNDTPDYSYVNPEPEYTEEQMEADPCIAVPDEEKAECQKEVQRGKDLEECYNKYSND